MQEIFFVKNGDLTRVNSYLEDGWKVKNITSVAESVAMDGVGTTSYGKSATGNVFAYIVLEK